MNIITDTPISTNDSLVIGGPDENIDFYFVGVVHHPPGKPVTVSYAERCNDAEDANTIYRKRAIFSCAKASVIQRKNNIVMIAP